MPAYHYRITVDMLQQPTGEEGLQSLSFFASHHNDLFTSASSLRNQFDLSACDATKLALALNLISQITLERYDRTLFHENELTTEA